MPPKPNSLDNDPISSQNSSTPVQPTIQSSTEVELPKTSEDTPSGSEASMSTTTNIPSPTPQSHSSIVSEVVVHDSDSAIVFDDNDSTLGGDDDGGSTTSIDSYIKKYPVENGRTYHAFNAGRYMLPNDEREKDRLDLQHHIFKLTFDKLLLCPIQSDKIHNVLDAGTGTGIWAIEVGDKLPNAQVFGIDLSPIQPTFVPPNVQFEVGDLEELWIYTKKFDLIYGRGLAGSLRDWPQFFKQSFE
jgi:hypothetical protein